MEEEDIHEKVMQEDEDPHEIEIYFDLVELDEKHDYEVSNVIIKYKNAQIMELHTNLERSKFVIS